MAIVKSVVVATEPIDGQRPGTSGLRKAVTVFRTQNYTENFVQAILDSAASASSDTGGIDCLVVGGDGRFYCRQACELIVKMAAANNVKRILVGQNGILSTPAVSAIIRKYKTSGGIILTASHNPGGPDGDFGIKFNIPNGGPAPDSVTTDIYNRTKSIDKYLLCPDLTMDISLIGTSEYEIDEVGRKFVVNVIDSVDDYLALMMDIFHFDSIGHLLTGTTSKPPLKILIDSMHGVTGPYAKRIFCDQLGADETSVVNCVPLPDFGGHHPDPNLTYAADLVAALKTNSAYGFGAAFDGDGDRNMIIGRNAFFVTPSDSLAVIAANVDAIPYFRRNGVKGFARSMPTGMAIDRVALKTGREIFEVPTGWKYFGNLMDAGRLSLCGEESFGTGSDHIREKDGIWAVLAWLSILAERNANVEDILHQHWTQYGRNFFTRYDYENVSSEAGEKLIGTLETLISQSDFEGRRLTSGQASFTVAKADDFQYTDPIDGSVALKQGIRVMFDDGSRIVYRLSGTGSSGATIRVYIEAYEADPAKHQLEAQEALRPLVEIALDISNLHKLTGREKPTVIT